MLSSNFYAFCRWRWWKHSLCLRKERLKSDEKPEFLKKNSPHLEYFAMIQSLFIFCRCFFTPRLHVACHVVTQKRQVSLFHLICWCGRTPGVWPWPLLSMDATWTEANTPTCPGVSFSFLLIKSRFSCLSMFETRLSVVGFHWLFTCCDDG